VLWCQKLHLCAPQNTLLCTGAKAATILIEHITKHPQKTVVAWPVVESQRGNPIWQPPSITPSICSALHPAFPSLQLHVNSANIMLLFVPMNTKRHPAIDHCTQPDSRHTGVSSEGSLLPLLHGYGVRGT